MAHSEVTPNQLPSNDHSRSFEVDESSYWFPKHFMPSAWLEHAPFGFWLVNSLRPSSIVELGTHNGFSYFVMAEAVRRLGIDCTVAAVDTWKGDDQAGFYEESVYESVVGIAQQDYPNFTRLHRAYFNEAVNQFSDRSIDLLHIDGRHGYDDVKEDFEIYRPKLSERAVVIFHDTFEFQEGFGVHDFWNEIAVTRPSFNFHHGHGLGVLAVGDLVPRGVIEFIERANEQSVAARATYAALGHDVARVQRDREAHDQRLVALESRLAEVMAETSALRTEARELRESTSWRFTAPLRKISALAHGVAGSNSSRPTDPKTRSA